MWIDSHCHLDLLQTEEVYNSLPALYQNGCQALLIPSTQGHPSPVAKQYQKVAEEHHSQLNTPEIYTSFGYHPWYISTSPLAHLETTEACFNFLQASLNTTTVVAIGETGLDKIHAHQPEFYLQQQQCFYAHCQLAEIHQLPLIIHSVKAHADTLHILKQFKAKLNGVIHGFSGSIEQAQAFIDLGFYIGVGGTITYPRAKKTREAIANIPLTSILLETDSPAMPLNGQQGQANSPNNIPLIADAIAELKQCSSFAVLEQSNINFYNMIKCKPTI